LGHADHEQMKIPLYSSLAEIHLYLLLYYYTLVGCSFNSIRVRLHLGTSLHSARIMTKKINVLM